MEYKGWVMSTRTSIDNLIGVYKDNDAWQADDASHECGSEEEAVRWIDEQERVHGAIGRFKMGHKIKEFIPIHEHGEHECYCPSCDIRRTVGAGIECNTQSCPRCGTRMMATTMGEFQEPQGHKSTPLDEAELRQRLDPLVAEENKAYSEYMLLSDNAYNIGRPDIAEKLKQIAEDEWKHHTVISEIVRGLR